MTQETDGSYFRPKHLKQTILSYSQFIENGQAKLEQHYQVLFLYILLLPLYTIVSFTDFSIYIGSCLKFCMQWGM